MVASRVLFSHSPGLCELEELAGSMYEEDGSNERSSAFSLLLESRNAQLSVHWTDVQGDKIEGYHLHIQHYYQMKNSGV